MISRVRILCLNGGSSSVKVALYESGASERRLSHTRAVLSAEPHGTDGSERRRECKSE